MKRLLHPKVLSIIIFSTILTITGLIYFSIPKFANSTDKFSFKEEQVHPQIFTASTDNNFIEEEWYSEVASDIYKDELNIVWDDKTGTYTSSNPMQNLLFTYNKAGFSVKPKEMQKSLLRDNNKSEIWSVDIKALGYGSDNNFYDFKSSKFTAEKNRAYSEGSGLKIAYLSNMKGMRQDFIIKERPKGAGNLKVELSVKTKLNTKIEKGAVSFISSTNNEEKLRYSNLKVTDANGKELEAWFEEIKASTIKSGLAIVVNDFEAKYPVTIDPISSTPKYMLECNQAVSMYGFTVSSAGDVNKDGYADVIVGASGYGTASNGGAFLYLGSKSGLSTTASWTFKGPSYASLGNCVACAGDVNGDGYSDVIIGASQYTNGSGQDYEGAAYVFYGSASGLASTENWRVESNQGDAYMGISVASAGDVNGDGYSDVIIGAYAYDNPDHDEGKVYVYYGSASGLLTTPAWTQEGNQADCYFGNSVACAGDVNGDGFSDVIVGAYVYDNGETDEGKAFLYYGSASGLSQTPNWTAESNQAGAYFGNCVASAGDVNKDGYSDVIIGSMYYNGGQSKEGAAFIYYGSATGLPNTENLRIECDQAEAEFGVGVASAGDVNGDGFDDIIIGARFYDDGETNEGAAFIYYGSKNGITTPYKWMGESNQAAAAMGKCVASTGDINGDGYSDFICGAAKYDNGQKDEGVAFVYFGADDPQPVELVSFKAERSGSSIILRWKTATEVNNYGFEIEKKIKQSGNEQWQKIGFVSGHGNSNSPKEYFFTDKNISAGKYLYRLKQIDNDGTSSYSPEVEVKLNSVLKENSLMQNYPNPFNPQTKISYTILNDSRVKLSVYNLLGQEVSVIVDEIQQAGGYEALWAPDNLAAGIYVYVIEAKSLDGKNSFKSVHKMVYMK
ncbi:MAG: FG-GAP-like repeat-containing protein [Bacteroidota bacterium]|nr:FG-GAP-like repeat-containing protein [Bacteroidota bacterium]